MSIYLKCIICIIKIILYLLVHLSIFNTYNFSLNVDQQWIPPRVLSTFDHGALVISSTPPIALSGPLCYRQQMLDQFVSRHSLSDWGYYVINLSI